MNRPRVDTDARPSAPTAAHLDQHPAACAASAGDRGGGAGAGGTQTHSHGDAGRGGDLAIQHLADQGRGVQAGIARRRVLVIGCRGIVGGGRDAAAADCGGACTSMDRRVCKKGPQAAGWGCRWLGSCHQGCPGGKLGGPCREDGGEGCAGCRLHRQAAAASIDHRFQHQRTGPAK